MNKTYHILTINPGSTSTKLEYWNDQNGEFSLKKEQKIIHPDDDLKQFSGQNVFNQVEYREQFIFKFLSEKQISLEKIDFIMGRGGFVLQPQLESGIYQVNEIMVEELSFKARENHASNLGSILAFRLAQKANRKITTAMMDPVVVDEMDDVSRISGMKEIPNQCFIHVLNQKAISERCAEDINKKYENCNFIVVHMGGGVSLAAHKQGRVVDAYNGMNGLGPFSPDRSGSVEPGKLIELCFSGKYNKSEIQKMNVGNGGLRNHLNTNSLIEVEEKIKEGDTYAQLVFDGMILQMSKFILSLAAIFKGESVDGIILTGGLAFSEKFTSGIIEMVSRISEVFVYPGGIEGEALACNAYDVLTGKKNMKKYLGLEKSLLKTPKE